MLTDLISLTIYLTFLTTDTTRLIEVNFSYINDIDLFFTACIPMIAAVISISLTLNKNEVYGLTIKDLNLNRSKWYFKFDHIIYIFISAIVLAVLSLCLQSSLSLIYLFGISLIYVVFIVHQEFMILLNKDKQIRKIIIDAYLEKKYFNKDIASSE